MSVTGTATWLEQLEERWNMVREVGEMVVIQGRVKLETKICKDSTPASWS